MNIHEIHKICKKYGIENYSINPDLSIDVNGDVVLAELLNGLFSLPLTFNKVNGSFFCYNNDLITLKGSPKWVGGSFIFYNNRLKSLKYSPEYVGKDYNGWGNSKITNFDHRPKFIGGDVFLNKIDIDGLNWEEKIENYLQINIVNYKEWDTNERRSKLIKNILNKI